MSAILSLLRSRLLRPVFVALGIALLVQVLVAVALTRSTVTALEADLGERLGNDSRQLASELEQAGQDVRSGLDGLSSSTRQRLSAGLATRLQSEQQQLRSTLEKNLKDSASDMAELLASVAPRAIWDNDVPVLSDFARRAQRNPNVLFVIYDDAQGQHLTRYLNRQNPINQALMEKGQGERALDKVIDAARRDPAVYFVEAPINPNGAEIGKVVMGVSTAGIDQELKALDQRFSALIASGEQLVGDSLNGAAADSGNTLRERLEKAQGSAAAMQANTAQTVRDAAAELRWRIGLGLAVVGLGVLLVVAVVLGRRVLSKLRLLITALNDLAAGEGDLTKRVSLDSRDEIGDMASAVNRFVDKLQPIVREAGEVAQRTGVEIGAMAQRNAGADAAAALQRDEVAASLRDLSSMADEAQAESHAMQAALQQVVDIRQATDENSRSSTQLASLIENLAGQVETGSQVIERLAKQSEQIEVVLTVIHGIAEQTNLLALNAAIEAARAGEAGRGFAVVADEVRNLAHRTQESAQQVQAMIEELQVGARASVETMDQSQRHSTDSMQIANQAGERLDSVTVRIGEIDGMNQSVATATEEQTAVVEAINMDINEINMLNQEGVENLQATLRACSDLEQQAGRLKHLVGSFRI